MVRTYSIPDKSKADVAMITKVIAHCKKRHINLSSVIVSLIRTWATEQGIIDEQRTR